MKRKIILDTDLGDDIDDAFALLLTCASPELELLGITTVYRCPKERAKMTGKLLQDAKWQAEIYSGEKYPLAQDSMYGKKIDFDKLPWSYSSEYDKITFNQKSAFDFMCETLEKESGVTLVAVGPLTNVAKLITERSDLAARLEKIVIMGGAYTINKAEYNIACDPEAAAIVFDSGLPIDLVGLDVTLKCVIPDDKLEGLWDKSAAFKTLYSMRSKWGYRVCLHDPLTVMSLLCEDVLTFAQAAVKVETKGEYTRGMTIVLSGCEWPVSAENSKTRIATSVNVDLFVKELFERLDRIN